MIRLRMASTSSVLPIRFTPSPDTAAILNDLLDAYERRSFSPSRSTPVELPAGEGVRESRRSIRCSMDSIVLPSYHSQTDPTPRQVVNEQLQVLEAAGWVNLAWLPGGTGHLIASVTLVPEHARSIFELLQRTPAAARRAQLTETLLGDRFRFSDWRRDAIDATLDQLREEKSPAPFNLADRNFNCDLLITLAALDEIREETPYRVFSVRVFNDSKRLDELIGAVATLARRHHPEWKGLSNDEVLRELNLVANPSHIFLHGSWELVDDQCHIMSLAEFYPSVGLPAAQVARLQQVKVAAPSVVCIENPTSFYGFIRSISQHFRGAEPAPGDPQSTFRSQQPHVALPKGAGGSLRGLVSAICLWGNPSPACRHLLRCLPQETQLLVWADIDYGGLNILAQLREQVNPNARPYRMDVETLDTHSQWARPLTPADKHSLTRLLRRPSLADMHPLITRILQRELKLEQEAIRLD